MGVPHFFERRGEVRVQANRLPHWHQANAICFITFRLADAMPAETHRRWRTEPVTPPADALTSAAASRDEGHHRALARRVEAWLDAGHGSGALRHPDTSAVIADALHFHAGQRSELDAYVVMPNHVHVLCGLIGEATLEGLVRDWKSYTSHVLAQRLGPAWPGWQKDYFDRLVRDQDHFARCVRYIRRNPAKARLRPGEFRLWESERARRIP